jgi:hypothetical protein
LLDAQCNAYNTPKTQFEHLQRRSEARDCDLSCNYVPPEGQGDEKGLSCSWIINKKGLSPSILDSVPILVLVEQFCTLLDNVLTQGGQMVILSVS